MTAYTKKLIQRVRDELKIELPDDVRVRCCRPGRSGLTAGAFRWVFESPTRIILALGDIGSVYTVLECSKAAKLETISEGWGDVFIEIE